MSNSKPSLAQFRQCEGTNCMFVTKGVSYPVGSIIAFVSSRIGLSPNQLSLISGLVATLGCIWAVAWLDSPILSGMVVLLTLHFSYAIDCADGVLARATGRTSSFGAVLDKVVDTYVSIVPMGILAFGGLSLASTSKQPWFFALFIVFLFARISISVTVWLKDAIRKIPRVGPTEPRARNWSRLIARTAGNFVDTPAFYSLLGLSWMVGGFWKLIAVYTPVLLVILVGYLFAAREEL